MHDLNSISNRIYITYVIYKMDNTVKIIITIHWMYACVDSEIYRTDCETNLNTAFRLSNLFSK